MWNNALNIATSSIYHSMYSFYISLFYKQGMLSIMIAVNYEKFLWRIIYNILSVTMF